jgi:hypothetical protein
METITDPEETTRCSEDLVTRALDRRAIAPAESSSASLGAMVD